MQKGGNARNAAGVCKTRTGFLRMANADGKMRREKCGSGKKMRITKKGRGKKREMRMAKKKINNQTNKGKKSFFQVAANSWHSFVPCNSFHQCHRNKDTPFLLLKCTHTWCTSPLSVQPKVCRQGKQLKKRLANEVSAKRGSDTCGWRMGNVTKTFLKCITLFGQQQQKRTKFPQIKRKLEKAN